MLHRAIFFYVDDGLVESIDPVWLQGHFDNLVGLFNRVRPRKISRRRSGYSISTAAQWEPSLKHLTSGERQGGGLTYQAQQR